MPKTTENEFRSQVVSWLNEFLSYGTYPFEVASNDPSVKVSGIYQFPDVQIWLNRQAQQGFCGWELKTPTTPVNDSELLSNAVGKAMAMNANFFVTWNMKDAVIWRTPQFGLKIDASDRVKQYPSLYHVNSADDMWVESNKVLLKSRTKDILNDLSTLCKEGHLNQIELDSTYFVGRLRNTVENIYPHIQNSLLSTVGNNATFKNGLFGWAVKQGIANYNDPSFYEAVSRQIVYRLLSRIIFYETLRRHWSMLPTIDLTGKTVEAANAALTSAFQKARDIDWHAVFEPDFSDGVPIPLFAIDELTRLVKDLNRFNFSLMPQDVIGSVFEKLIPHHERHSLGQYFTREDLVDLINAFCIKTVNALVLDPTSGTGTFLTRAYNKKWTQGQKEHKKLLSQIWGIDIAHFPAQLATINLFRQELSDFANFPRIICQDVFTVKEGQAFKFPPPKANSVSPIIMIEEKLPAFDAAVGNFPFIRQEIIEQKEKGYKGKLVKTIAEEWLTEYPGAFTISGKPLTENEINEYKRTKIIDFSTVDMKLAGQADIYAYLFFHIARFIKEGGRMGFITSNSWLDVAYGYQLQRFFLENFKIIAIIESRCEPWFEDANVNTIVTILERCASPQERTDNITKFVKVKKKLADLIPWDMKMEASKRWHGLDGIAYKIENIENIKNVDKSANVTVLNNGSGLSNYDDNDFRIRFLKQGELKNLFKDGQTSKWGQYLRAPKVYFDILNQLSSKLTTLQEVSDINSGIKTGINDFFYFSAEKIQHWKIEDEFLVPVIKSPRESESIMISPEKLKQKLFVCHLSKEELQKQNKSGALIYIEWGEKQKNENGVKWPDISSVSSRSLWYNLGDRVSGSILPFINSGDIHRILYNPGKVYVDHNLFEIIAEPEIELGLLLFLNSSLAGLFKEVIGRANLGEGGLKVEGVDWENFLCPNKRVLKKISKSSHGKFDDLLSRKIQTINFEIKLVDRQQLDTLVLNAMGIDPQNYLPSIYSGLTELVAERTGLAEMRANNKKTKIIRDIESLKHQVILEILPNGIKKFPDEFLDSKLKMSDYENISVPAEQLKLGYSFMGEQEVISDKGLVYKAKNTLDAKYIIYSQKPNTFTISVPKNNIIVSKAVNNFEIYLDELKSKLTEALLTRTFDHQLSDKLAQTIINEFVPSGKLP